MPPYIPRWIPISEALDHVDAVDLEPALRDGAVAARSVDDFEPIDARKWSADIRWINGAKLLLGDGRVEFCRAQVEELARKTKGPIKAWVPATEGGLIAGDEPGAANWRSVVPDPAYPIRESHTAYEWSMALGGEVHPYGNRIADRFGSRGDLRADAIAGMQARERAVEGWSDQARAIYCVLKAEFEAGRIEPLRRAWCLDPAGVDSPVPDFSRYVFGIEVLQLIRHRGDTDRLIGELLAAEDRTTATIPSQPNAIALELQDKGEREEAQDGATNRNSLAERISLLPEGTVQAVATPPKYQDSGRRRGREPVTFNRVKDAMIADLRAVLAGDGERDPRKMLQKRWQDDYGASRDTCSRAFAAACEKLGISSTVE
jgi:hypothetical protein